MEAYERTRDAGPRLETVLFAAALALSVAVLLWLGSGLTFIQDTWAFLLDRPGFNADAFFTPHNEHIVVIPVAIEKLLVEVFGMTSAAPERVVLTLMLAATGALLFAYVRRRIGGWPALIAAFLFLFLGPAWSVLLWPFEIVLVGSLLTGIAMLLVLERGDRVGDAWACVLLTLSIGFSSLGVPFIAAAAVDAYQRRHRRGLGRAWVAALPLLLYLAWYAGWGHTAEHHLSLNNVLSSPVYTLNGFASSIDSLLGLSTIDVNGHGQPEWGRPLLVALVGLVIYGQIRRPGFSPPLWPVLAAALAYWLLAAVNYFPGREAVEGRYQYAGAAFVLLIAADLLEGLRISRRALSVAGAVAVLAVASNMVGLREGRTWLRNLSLLTKSDLAAIEIASRTVPPEFSLEPEVAGTGSLATIDAGSYLSAVREHGSPAYTPEQLATAPEEGRRQADIVLAKALPLSTESRSGALPDAERKSCVTVPGGSPAAAEVQLAPGSTKIEVAPGAHASFSLRRFAVGEYPVTTEGAAGGTVTLLRIPSDLAPQPWYLHVQAGQRVRVCA